MDPIVPTVCNPGDRPEFDAAVIEHALAAQALEDANCARNRANRRFHRADEMLELISQQAAVAIDLTIDYCICTTRPPNWDGKTLLKFDLSHDNHSFEWMSKMAEARKAGRLAQKSASLPYHLVQALQQLCSATQLAITLTQAVTPEDGGRLTPAQVLTASMWQTSLETVQKFLATGMHETTAADLNQQLDKFKVRTDHMVRKLADATDQVKEAQEDLVEKYPDWVAKPDATEPGPEKTDKTDPQ